MSSKTQHTSVDIMAYAASNSLSESLWRLSNSSPGLQISAFAQIIFFPTVISESLSHSSRSSVNNEYFRKFPRCPTQNCFLHILSWGCFLPLLLHLFQCDILDVSYLLYLSLGKFLKVTDDTFLFLLSPLPSIGQCRKTIFFNLQTLLIFKDLILYSDRVAFLFTTTHHIRIIFRDISYNENYNIVIIGTARFFIAFT